MPVGIVFFVVWSLFMLIMATLMYIWGKSTGQFKDIESPNYQIFEDKELEEWPNRKKKAQGEAKEKGPGDQKGGK